MYGYSIPERSSHDLNEVGVSYVKRNSEKGLFFTIVITMAVSLILLERLNIGLMFLTKSKTPQVNFTYCVILIIILLALMGKCQTQNGVGLMRSGGNLNEM